MLTRPPPLLLLLLLAGAVATAPCKMANGTASAANSRPIVVGYITKLCVKTWGYNAAIGKLVSAGDWVLAASATVTAATNITAEASSFLPLMLPVLMLLPVVHCQRQHYRCQYLGRRSCGVVPASVVFLSALLRLAMN